MFAAEADSETEILFLNFKLYNYCFLLSIKNAEKERKMFILKTINTLQDLPKHRMEIFIKNLNIEVKI